MTLNVLIYIISTSIFLITIYSLLRFYKAVRMDLAKTYKLEMLDYAFRTGGDWKDKMRWQEEITFDLLVNSLLPFDRVITGRYAADFIAWRKKKTSCFGHESK